MSSARPSRRLSRGGLSILATVVVFLSICVPRDLRADVTSLRACDQRLIDPSGVVHAWERKNASPKIWSDPRVVRGYFDWLRLVMNLNGVDWYQRVTTQMLIDHHGAGLLASFPEWSLRRILSAAYPEFRHYSFRNRRWSVEERKAAFAELAALKGWTSFEDWYQFQNSDYDLIGRGQSLIDFYGTRGRLLEFLFPGREVEEWRFKTLPPRFWNKPENRRRFFAKFEPSQTLSVEDWYAQTSSVFRGTPGLSMLRDYYKNSLYELLRDLKPEVNWDPERFPTDLKSQREVLLALKAWLPCLSFGWNVKLKHLRFPDTKRPIEIDIHLADLRIGVEYQGEQHYGPIAHWGGDAKYATQIERDAIKRKLFEADGQRLIEVPYWAAKTATALRELFVNELGSDEVRRIEGLCR